MAALGLVLYPVEGFTDDPNQAEIIEMSALSFGQIGRPTTSANSFMLHWQNNHVTIGGTGDGFHLGDGSSGRYRIHGVGNQAITFSAEILSFSANGIYLDEVYVNGNSNTYSTSLNGEGVFIARIGGVVIIEPNATIGLHETDLLMTINYE